MDPAYLAPVLLVVGLGLIVSEVFIPSAGMIAMLAGLCFLGSIWSAWSAWWYSNPTIFAVYVVSLLLLIPSAISGAFYLLSRTAIGRHVLLESPELHEVTPYQQEQRELERLIGRLGQTLTLLNPGGLVSVDGNRHHCESEGILIEPGSSVEIVAVRVNRVVVRPVDGFVNEDASTSRRAEAEGRTPLDFDLPQS